MKRSKPALRRVILSRLYEHLQREYGVPVSREEFVEGTWSPSRIDGLLAFKSDYWIEELRTALDRLDEGTYGTCIGCHGTIAPRTLQQDPSRRVCDACERRFSHQMTESLERPLGAAR